VPTTVLLVVSSVEEWTVPSEKPDTVQLEACSSGWVHVSEDLTWAPPKAQHDSEIIIDLGVGEAPYDDGFLDYEMDFSPLVGFSDALMQLEYRARIQPGTSIFGIAAMNRVQDDTILQAMGQNDWAWFGMGVQISW
jgi:hypothetical protein